MLVSPFRTSTARRTAAAAAMVRRLRASEMQGSADEVDERELHVAVELIENARAMLRYVAPLSQFAVIEVR